LTGVLHLLEEKRRSKDGGRVSGRQEKNRGSAEKEMGEDQS
jgi:hypothetical protein